MIFDYSQYVEEKASEGIVNYRVINTNKAFFVHDELCPFCKQACKEVFRKSKRDYPEWLYGSFDEYEHVIQCPICGWWEYKYHNQSDAILDGIRASDTVYTSAVIKKYNDYSVDVPVTVLREYIQRHPNVIYNIDAHKMEELVRSVFSDFYPSCRVKSFGKTRDGGKDAILIDDSGQQILIQVKRRTNANSTEGVVALRELIGVSVIEDNVNGCIFVSTADHYSDPAKKYAEKVLEKHYIERFDLIDCKEFLKMIDLTKDALPKAWNSLLRIDK